MMEVTFTCEECGSAIDVNPSLDQREVECSICSTVNKFKFDEHHLQSELCSCPKCERKDFYKQKDFNRKIGVILFVIASILAIFTYGISLIVLYVFDFFLYRILGDIAVCYKCNTIFRKVKNIENIYPFDHEMNDRIVYSDHDFGGKAPTH